MSGSDSEGGFRGRGSRGGPAAATTSPPASRNPISEGNRQAFLRKGRVLEYVTLGWNAVEALVAVGSGLMARSPALVGFGVDSLIEASSGAILLWRLSGGEAEGEDREELALRLVGVSFLLLAGWVGWEAGTALLGKESPDESWIGIVLAAVSLVVMPLLARAKRRVAAGLESKALVADSRQTDLCAYLSAILLAGLGLNATLGWWWADPVAALAMVPIIGREGVTALKGDVCGDCHVDFSRAAAEKGDDECGEEGATCGCR